MATISNELKMFCANNTDFYEAAIAYFCDNGAKTLENKNLMNDAFFAEVERKAGIARKDVEFGAWSNHPVVKWSAMAIVDAVINAILPVTILPQFGMFADFRPVALGETTHFRVRPNQLYTISRGAHAERVTMRQRHAEADVFMTPVEHIVTIFENLYSVLAGRTDIADFLGFVMLSVQTEMYKDALSALITGITGTTAYTYTGAFALAQLLQLCEKVQAKNGGIKPVICGSATALLNVVPNATAGYRVNVDGKDGAIELIKSAFGYDIIKLENALAGDNLVLPTDKLFIVCPGADKLIKGVMTAGMANGNDAFMNADITKDYTFRKDWDFQYLSAAKGGCYVIQE